jgi:hypothetical protein
MQMDVLVPVLTLGDMSRIYRPRRRILKGDFNRQVSPTDFVERLPQIYEISQ